MSFEEANNILWNHRNNIKRFTLLKEQLEVIASRLECSSPILSWAPRPSGSDKSKNDNQLQRKIDLEEEAASLLETMTKVQKTIDAISKEDVDAGIVLFKFYDLMWTIPEIESYYEETIKRPVDEKTIKRYKSRGVQIFSEIFSHVPKCP